MPKERTELEILTDFMRGINMAIDGVSQMVHHRINPKFIAMRDMLTIISDRTQKMIKNKTSV